MAQENCGYFIVAVQFVQLTYLFSKMFVLGKKKIVTAKSPEESVEDAR